MMKKMKACTVIGLFLFLFFIFKMNVSAIVDDQAVDEKLHCSSNVGDGVYSIRLAEEIVEYNREITFIINGNSSNQRSMEDLDIQLHLSSTLNLKKRVFYNDSTIEFKVQNTYPVGEFQFELEMTKDANPQYQVVYAYSDGKRVCLSLASIEDCRDLYYTNYVATEEELYLLGRVENIPENFQFTMTQYEAYENYAKSVGINQNITVSTSCRQNYSLNNEIRVCGTIKWIDEKGVTHPVRQQRVQIYDEDVSWDDFMGECYTDDTGEYSFEVIDNFDPFNGADVYVKIQPENKAVIVQGENVEYSYQTVIYDNVYKCYEIRYDIVIGTGDDYVSENAYEISQMMLLPYNYMKEMYYTLNHIEVIYPQSGINCYYSNKKIYMEKPYYKYWDVGTHEYGHYIDDMLNLSAMPGGAHNVGEDLVAKYGKDKGLKLAYSEGLATYIGIISQFEYNTSKWNIPTLGDYIYTSYAIDRNNAIYEMKINLENFTIDSGSLEPRGEGNEISIAGFLLSIVTKSNLLENDIELFNFIKRYNNNMDELVKRLVNTYGYANDIGKFLNFYGFSTFITSPITELNYREIEFPLNIWNCTSSNLVCSDISFAMIFYSSDLKWCYVIENISFSYLPGKYVLSMDDLCEIFDLGTDLIYYQLFVFYRTEFETGPYFTELLPLKLSNSSQNEEKNMDRDLVYNTRISYCSLNENKVSLYMNNNLIIFISNEEFNIRKEYY